MQVGVNGMPTRYPMAMYHKVHDRVGFEDKAKQGGTAG